MVSSIGSPRGFHRVVLGNWGFVLLLPFVLALLLTLSACSRGDSESPSLTVGAVYVGSIADSGYNQAHHIGLLEMQDRIPELLLLDAENIPEDAAAERVMRRMIADGARLIFATSFGYQDIALELADEFPDVVFEHAGGFKSAPNFGTYYANTYQALYLMGIAAGMMTESNQLGIIAGFPIPSILAEINAFHLGANSVNPDARTRVIFQNSWLDPVKEASAVDALAFEEVDVAMAIVDSPITVIQAAERRRMYSIGYHLIELKEFAPDYWITGVGLTWADFYTRTAESVIAGTWKQANVKGDLESGMVGFADWGPRVQEQVQRAVRQAREKILSGELQVFSGPIRDQNGQVRIATGETAGAELQDSTDWLVEGVIGTPR